MKDFQQLTIEVTRRYLMDYSPSLGPKLASTLEGWIRSRAIAKLAKASELFDDASHGVEVLRTLLQVEAFFKKSNAFSRTDVTRAAALSSFEKGERRCRITNRRLDYYSEHPERMNSHRRSAIERVRRIISKVLGPYEDFHRNLPVMIRLTSGAAADSSRKNSTPLRKLRRKIPSTPGAQPYIVALSRYYGYKVRTQRTMMNRVALVPKNWKTDRTIACEPVGNLPLQLAFDRYVKDRLKTLGINLRSQLRNQELARRGSISGCYATLDLEGASDSLSVSAVAWLLPDDWWKYLNDIRCPLYTLDGQVGVYAKFSSMGNGATFALETLVFGAICAAFTKDFAVYGDDIIVPPEHVESIVELLKFFGFILNSEKSHTTGHFRESCGVNCFNGQDITPFYLRSWRELLTDFHHNVNGLVAISKPAGYLMSFLVDLIKDRKDAILVPQNESTISGIFIDITESYNRRLIKWCSYGNKNKLVKTPRGTIPTFNGLVSRRRSHLVCDSRALFLWFLDKSYQSWRDYETTATSQRTLEPSAVQKYVRSKVLFRPTTCKGRGPESQENHRQLYWLSECLRLP